MTTRSIDLPSRLKSAWDALRGTPTEPGDPRARIAALELDLRERDAELARVREEYGRLGGQAERDRAGAVAEGLGGLAKRLAPLFSQLATMQSMAEAGRELRCADALKLFGKVEGVLGEAGLTRIGSVGEQVPFDTRLHQRLSGAGVPDDAPVAIRFVGYRLGETIVLKAMVSRAEAAPEPADEV
jgi:molecular chaperone GrpE (heat shock protein)